MKKILFLILTLCVLAGCKPVSYEIDYKDNNRFQTVYTQDGGIRIVIDKKTDVKYLIIRHGYGIGITRLVEPNDHSITKEPDTCTEEYY